MNIYLYNRKQIITNTYAYNIKKRFLIIPPHKSGLGLFCETNRKRVGLPYGEVKTENKNETTQQ
jgi:hypothetical protein